MYIPCQAYNRTGIGHVKDFITFETVLVLFLVLFEILSCPWAEAAHTRR